MKLRNIVNVLQQEMATVTREDGCGERDAGDGVRMKVVTKLRVSMMTALMTVNASLAKSYRYLWHRLQPDSWRWCELSSDDCDSVESDGSDDKDRAEVLAVVTITRKQKAIHGNSIKVTFFLGILLFFALIFFTSWRIYSLTGRGFLPSFFGRPFRAKEITKPRKSTNHA
jgi:hypothetical protein